MDIAAPEGQDVASKGDARTYDTSSEGHARREMQGWTMQPQRKMLEKKTDGTSSDGEVRTDGAS